MENKNTKKPTHFELMDINERLKSEKREST